MNSYLAVVAVADVLNPAVETNLEAAGMTVDRVSAADVEGGVLLSGGYDAYVYGRHQYRFNFSGSSDAISPAMSSAMRSFVDAGKGVVTEWDGYAWLWDGYDSTYRYDTGAPQSEYLAGDVGAGYYLGSGTNIDQALNHPIWSDLPSSFSAGGGTDFFYTTYNSDPTQYDTIATFQGNGSTNFPNQTFPAVIAGKNENFVGISFDWQDRANDPNLVTLYVNAVDFAANRVLGDPPEAISDSYDVDEDNILTVNATDGVLGNDSDPDGDSLTVVIDTPPANGSLTLNSDGSFDYTPALDFNGTDSFTYEVSDGKGGTGTATVNITIDPVNDAPRFTAGADQQVDEDAGPQTVSGWATGISPGPANEVGQNVSFNVSNDNSSLFSSQPAIAPDGTLSYTPAVNAFGTATVTVAAVDDGGTANGGDDASDPQTVVITVNSVIDAQIDVKPGSDTNPLNLGSKGVVPIGILSTQQENGAIDTFNATTLDPSSDTFFLNGVQVDPVHAAFEDIDGDGDLDLLLHFSMEELVDEGVVDENSTDLVLTAEYGGAALGHDLGGSDSVTIVPKKGNGNSNGGGNGNGNGN